MSNEIKGRNINNRTYYFFNDIINGEDFESNNIKKDEKSCKNILISYIGYVTIKEYLNIYSVNLLYLTFRYVNETLKKLIEIDI